MDLFFYDLSRPKAYAIGETGTYQEVATEEKPLVYRDRHYEEYRTLRGRLQVSSYDEEEGTFTLPTAQGDFPHAIDQVWFTKTASFTLPEVGALLGISAPIVERLLSKQYLPFQQKGAHKMVCGDDLLKCSLLLQEFLEQLKREQAS